ncbi:MAG: hypothetical protein ACFFC7_35430 [Candidatus Hermodarchaeota archaeon]
MSYQDSRHVVFLIIYHVILMPKYSRRILLDPINQRLIILIQEYPNKIG